MTVVGRFDLSWKARRAVSQLRRMGDSRQLSIEHDPAGDPRHPFVVRASGSAGTDVPVGRDGWPGLELGPQDVHGSDAA
jgi:hypothetical protein